MSYIFILVIILYHIEVFGCREFNHNALGLKNTLSIKGVSSIIIVIHHVTQRMESPGILFLFRRSGYLAVSLFLFYSGYGLMKSYNSKNDYLQGFWTKRMSKLVIPFILSNIIFILIDLAQGNRFSIYEILIYTLGIKLIDGVKWYVIAIIILYISFYISFKYLDKNKAIINVFFMITMYIIACKLIGKGEWWYNTIYNFGVGIIVAQYYESLLSIISKNYIKLLISIFLMFLLTFRFNSNILINFLSSILFILLCICILAKVEIGNKITYQLGTISYEIYLMHMLILNIFEIDSSKYYLLICVIGSIILAYIFKILSQKVIMYYEKIVLDNKKELVATQSH